MAGQVAFPYFQTTASPVRAKRLQALAPRMAPSALRVPHPIHAQFPLVFVTNHPQVFVHEGARQSLERRLEVAFGGPVALHINDNVRSIITVRRRAGQLRARVHHMFLDAPHSVQEALVRYLVGEGEGSSEARAASGLINRYIADNHHRIRASRPPIHPLKTEGEVHDLLAIFRRVNERYFGGTHDALVTWGRGGPKNTKTKGGRATRRSIKLGSYSAVERLIRVHPVLDRPWVPRYFVEYIVYHEMLHHVIPTSRACGRAVLHPPEFRQREREFHIYERAIAWEREHIGRLLRALGGRVLTPRPPLRRLRAGRGGELGGASSGKLTALPSLRRRPRRGAGGEEGACDSLAHRMTSGPPPVEDAKFLERLRSRDERAFNQLVRMYERRVYGLVFRMLGRRDEAEDIAQEVFVQVFKAIDTFRGESKLSTWVYRIAVNLCKNRSKYNSRRHSGEQDDVQEVAERVPLHQAKGVTTSDVSGPEDDFAGREVERVVQQAIAKLEPEFREVLVLRDVEDLSYEEIAQITGLPDGTVKSRIHRARGQLKALVEAALGEKIR